MTYLGFTVKKNLASSLREYLKSQGRNVSEEDIDKILQRLIDVNSKRPPKESIFSGGHKYFGGSGKDFIVKDKQEINLSAKEYNEIFDGYLEKAKDIPLKTESVETLSKPEQKNSLLSEQEEKFLNDEALKSIKNHAFKTSIANMSDKQLKQIANSDNLTTDIVQLKIIAQELELRGDKEGAKTIAKTILAIEPPQLGYKEVYEDSSFKIPESEVKETVSSPIPAQQKSIEIKINPSDEEIQSNIANLTPGESYTYLQVKNQSTWGYGQNQKNVTWTRNEDNTLTKMTPDFKIDGDFGALTEKYTSDGKELISKTKLGAIYLTKGLYTTTEYSNSKPVKETTYLKDMQRIKISQGNLPHAEKILGIMSPELRIYKNDKFKNNAISIDNQTFASKELKNLKGETILTYKDGKFFNNKNEETDYEQAKKIINEQIENNDLSELVKNYNT